LFRQFCLEGIYIQKFKRNKNNIIDDGQGSLHKVNGKHFSFLRPDRINVISVSVMNEKNLPIPTGLSI
jgi:hypothetical protein